MPVKLQRRRYAKPWPRASGEMSKRLYLLHLARICLLEVARLAKRAA